MERPHRIAAVSRSWNDFRRAMVGRGFSMRELGEIWRARDDPLVDPAPVNCPRTEYEEPLPSHIRAILRGIKDTICETIPRFVVPRYRERFLELLDASEETIAFADGRYLMLRRGRVQEIVVPTGSIPYAHLESVGVSLSYTVRSAVGLKVTSTYVPDFLLEESPFRTERDIDAWLAEVKRLLTERFGHAFQNATANYAVNVWGAQFMHFALSNWKAPSRTE